MRGAIGVSQTRPLLPRISSRKPTVKVLSFQANSATSATFPTPWFGDSKSATLSPSFQYHRCWQELSSQESTSTATTVGSEGYMQSLGPAAGKALAAELCVAPAEGTSKDSFIMFSSHMKGSGGGLDSTQEVHGLYRLHHDGQGRVAEAWCFRSPTTEERDALFKLPSALGGKDKPLRATQSSKPCDWSVDGAYTSRIHAAAKAWAQGVWSEASLQALHSLAAHHVTYVDGTGLYNEGRLVPGVSGLEEVLSSESRAYELGPCTVLASVAYENKVFMHWSQATTCRKSRAVVQVDGASMMEFDEAGQVIHVLDYPIPLEANQVAQLTGSSTPAQGPQGQPAVKSLPAGVDAEALARQEREWSAW